MSQNDFSIANQTASNFRSDLNSALQALASLSSGGTQPSTRYANMLWYDTSANILKVRNEANSAWINLGYLDQSANAFRILDNTQVTNTSGTQTGLLGDQSTATWQAGTGTTESLVSPAKIKAAIDSLGTQVTTANVTTAIASSSVGAVGTYAFLGDNGTVVAYGGTTAGSNLDYRGVTDNPFDSNTGQVPNNNISPAGTWRAMGILAPYNSEGYQSATLFLRIA